MAREYKHSGIEWIGEIPKEWIPARFRYSGCFIKGKLPATQNNENKGFPVIGASEMLGKEPRLYTEDSNIPMCSDEDILILWDGANAGIIANKCKGAVSSTAVKYSCTDKRFNKQYMFYLLKNAEPFFKSKVGGTTIPHMNTRYIDEYLCILPTLSEQQKIADYLDKVCGEVDEMIALQEQMIEELKAYKQSVITEAVTKGLNPNTPMKDSGIDWIKELPENWEVVTPKALFSLRKEKAIEGERQLTASQQYGVIYQDEYMQLTGTKVVTVMKDFDILKHVEAGDFVISMRSFQGGLEYSENTGSISSAYVMLIPNLEYVHPKFYRWLFKSVCYINALQSTSNMVRDGQAMRYSNFAQVPLYIVPLKEQQSIASYLDEKCAEIDALIAIKQAKIEELKEYKKSVIYEYVTGKKEVV